MTSEEQAWAAKAGVCSAEGNVGGYPKISGAEDEGRQQVQGPEEHQQGANVKDLCALMHDKVWTSLANAPCPNSENDRAESGKLFILAHP